MSGGHFLALLNSQTSLPCLVRPHTTHSSFFCTCPPSTTRGSDSSMIRVLFLPQAGLQSSFLLTECFGNRPAGNPYRNPNLHRRNQVAPRPKSLHCTFSRSVSLQLPSRSWFVSLPVCCLTLLSRTLHTRTLDRRKYLLLKPLPSKNNPMYEPTTD